MLELKLTIGLFGNMTTTARPRLVMYSFDSMMYYVDVCQVGRLKQFPVLSTIIVRFMSFVKISSLGISGAVDVDYFAFDMTTLLKFVIP
jgi:hypothetical protein